MVSIPRDWPETYQDVPADPLQASNAAFQADKRPGKINLGIGMVMDHGTGQAYMSPTLRGVARKVAYLMPGYQTSYGHASYVERHAKEMVFGEELWNELEPYCVRIQTLGGTKGLNLSAAVLKAKLPEEQQHLYGDTHWANHATVFRDFQITSYEHEDPQTRTYNHEAFMEGLMKHPPRCPVLLQAGGYNPDGTERTEAQWDEVVAQLAGSGRDVILDFPYNGLVQGFGPDSYPVKALAKAGIRTFVCVSNSKNGSYEAKLGSLYIINVSKDPAVVARFKKNFEEVQVRGDYSNPPKSIAAAMAIVLGDQQLANAHDRLIPTGEPTIGSVDELKPRYFEDIRHTREDIINRTRTDLSAAMGEDFNWMRNKRGIFLRLQTRNLNTPALEYLIKDNAIHIPPDSRINLGGVPPDRTEEVAEKLKKALELAN